MAKFFYVVEETQNIEFRGKDDYDHTEYRIVQKFDHLDEAKKFLEDNELPLDEEIEVKSEKKDHETLDVDVFYSIVEMTEAESRDQAYIQEHFRDWKPDHK